MGGGGGMRGRKQSRMTPELGTDMVPLHFWFRFGGGEKWKTGETHFSTGKRQRTASESLMDGEKDNQSHGHRPASHRGLAAAPSEAPQSFSGTALGQSHAMLPGVEAVGHQAAAVLLAFFRLPEQGLIDF